MGSPCGASSPAAAATPPPDHQESAAQAARAPHAAPSGRLLGAGSRERRWREGVDLATLPVPGRGFKPPDDCKVASGRGERERSCGSTSCADNEASSGASTAHTGGEQRRAPRSEDLLKERKSPSRPRSKDGAAGLGPPPPGNGGPLSPALGWRRAERDCGRPAVQDGDAAAMQGAAAAATVAAAVERVRRLVDKEPSSPQPRYRSAAAGPSLSPPPKAKNSLTGIGALAMLREELQQRRAA